APAWAQTIGVSMAYFDQNFLTIIRQAIDKEAKARGITVQLEELGLVISAALIGLSLGAMLSGPLSDRFGRKVVIINSVFFFGV
ncbi:MFS transporter, partial [Serratia sp. ME43]|uniref:MFS transporter n=1 Tax=Serratia sp. ME43 TaxID=2744256 RepID=UPI001C713131